MNQQMYRVRVSWKTSTRANAGTHSARWMVVASSPSDALERLAAVEPRYNQGANGWLTPSVEVLALGQVAGI